MCLSGLALARRYLLRWSWDEVSAAQGMRLLVDGMHLNATAAQLLASLLRPLLEPLQPAECG
jgi:hypothetical protein